MLKKLFKKNRTFYFFYSFIISIVFFIYYQETRNVNVLSKKHTFKYNNQLTNKNITITFQSHIPNFSYIKDPSNKTYKQSNPTIITGSTREIADIIYFHE